jgi:hypothetical protein
MNQRSRDPRKAPRNPSWYRQEAERVRQRAATITADDQLRDSYLCLAREYERLAATLERGSPDHNTDPRR